MALNIQHSEHPIQLRWEPSSGEGTDLPPRLTKQSAGHEVQRLEGGLVTRNDDERRRMARVLHDTTAQNLAALSINLALAARENDPQRIQAILAECFSLTDECLEEVRAVSSMLHPPLLDDFGLESALRLFLDQYARRTGISVELRSSGSIGRLPPELELGAFRIAQETLFDREHDRGTSRAEVVLSRTNSEFRMMVRDWAPQAGGGAGPSESIALGGISERARLLGGSIEIDRSESGTKVCAIFRMED